MNLPNLSTEKPIIVLVFGKGMQIDANISINPDPIQDIETDYAWKLLSTESKENILAAVEVYKNIPVHHSLEIAFLGGPTGGSDIPAESTLMARIFDAIVHTYHVPHEVPFREVTLYTEPKSLDTIQNIKFFLHRIYPQIQEKYPGREKENFTWIGISCGFHIPRLKRIAAYNHLQFDYLVKSPVHPSTVKLKIPKRTKIFYLFEHLREGMLLAILPWILRYSNRLGPEDKALKMFRGSGITARISSFLRFFTHK